MAQDLFLSASSPAKLAEEIAKKMVEDNRSLPDRAKIFAAVAKMQEFDRFPDLKPPEEIERLIATGQYKELNRGLCGTNGIPALLYARELVRGQLYPGTQSAFGTGIYFADMGCPLKL